MSLTLHQRILLFILSIVPILPLAQADGETSPSDTDWNAIIEAAEAADDWAADPFTDLGLFENAETNLLMIGSLKVGFGESSNFLKQSDPVSSRYFRVEADAWLNWFNEHSTLTALLFAETNIYESIDTIEVDDEFLIFSQVAYRIPKKDTAYGIEGMALFADQVYDASLSPNGIRGTRIEQFRPEVMAYVDGYPGQLDRLRVAISTLRAEYNIEQEDYGEPMISGEWERLWGSSLRTVTKTEISRQFYDDAVGRYPDGRVISGNIPLRVDRFLIEERISWKPEAVTGLEVNTSFGVSWNKDQSGSYESMRQSWASLRTKVSGDWGQLRVTGRWLEMLYDERSVSDNDSTPVLHNQRALKVEYKWPLPTPFNIYLRMEWTRLDSRVDEDQYSERRGEALFEWSY